MIVPLTDHVFICKWAFHFEHTVQSASDGAPPTWRAGPGTCTCRWYGHLQVAGPRRFGEQEFGGKAGLGSPTEVSGIWLLARSTRGRAKYFVRLKSACEIHGVGWSGYPHEGWMARISRIARKNGHCTYCVYSCWCEGWKCGDGVGD